MAIAFKGVLYHVRAKLLLSFAFRSTNTNIKKANNDISLGNAYTINIMIIIISAINTASIKFIDNLHESGDCCLNTLDE